MRSSRQWNTHLCLLLWKNGIWKESCGGSLLSVAFSLCGPTAVQLVLEPTLGSHNGLFQGRSQVPATRGFQTVHSEKQALPSFCFLSPVTTGTVKEPSTVDLYNVTGTNSLHIQSTNKNQQFPFI